MAPPLRTAVIGTGIFSRKRHLPAFEKQRDKFQIVACCNRSREKAEIFADEAKISHEHIHSGLDGLLKSEPEVEALDVILPPTDNLAATKAALSSGKHIVLEKPIAHSIEDAREIVRLAESSEKVVMIAENFVHRKYVREMKAFIEDGHLGEVVTFIMTAVRPYNPESPYVKTAWRANPAHPGGFLSDAGVHDMGLLTAVLGQVTSASAATRQQYEIHGADDTLTATLRLASGAVGSYISTVAATTGSFRMEIFGTKATLRLVEGLVTVEDKQGKRELCFMAPDEDDVEAEMVDFYAAVREGKKLTCTPRDTFHHLAVIIAALQSAESGREEKVMEP
ncbi:uncharacterized protein VTP21DRAFT_4642 [Calcarisporiella thermophila]|uniref:uncharacterized protein n=1 Tax=Calcarisporiella thermophila TaxID=911321 RepID=UPI0037437327